MTPEEIVSALSEKNRELLVARGLPINEGILQLLNQASIRAFRLGSDTALSMVQGALAVQLMKADK